MRRALLALAVVLVLPASTEAAPPWSAPRDVSEPHTFVDGLCAGAAVAILRGSDLRVAIRSSGRFGPGRRIVKRPRIASPVLSANPRGDLALAWFEDRGTAHDRVYVALRRTGHRFGTPIRLATGRIRSVAVAIGSRGDVLVAWDARGKVRTRFKRHGHGHGFGRAQTPRSDPTFFATLHAAVSSSGRAYVAWAAQFLSEGGDHGPGFYEVAVRPAGAPRFRTARRLERIAADRNVGSLDLALTGRGNALVAWASDRVRAVETDASGHFGAPRDLSAAAPEQDLTPPGGIDAVATPVGARLVTWTAAGLLVQAAFAPAGGAFSPPEDVASGELARAAFSPGPTLAWQVRRADGVHVQEATRAG